MISEGKSSLPKGFMLANGNVKQSPPHAVLPYTENCRTWYSVYQWDQISPRTQETHVKDICLIKEFALYTISLKLTLYLAFEMLQIFFLVQKLKLSKYFYLHFNFLGYLGIHLVIKLLKMFFGVIWGGGRGRYNFQIIFITFISAYQSSVNGLYPRQGSCSTHEEVLTRGS